MALSIQILKKLNIPVGAANSKGEHVNRAIEADHKKEKGWELQIAAKFMSFSSGRFSTSKMLSTAMQLGGLAR